MKRVRVRRKIVVWMLLLIPIVVSLTIVGIGSASDLPNVSLDPPSIRDPTMVPGTQFTIDLDVDYVDQLWAYQLTLSFDPEVLHGVWYDEGDGIPIENGPFLEAYGGTALLVKGQGWNNTEGTLALFGACLFPVQYFPSGGSDELGPLATITFEVVGFGFSPITLGPETKLANSTGGPIIHKEENPENFEDGYFDNTPPQLWIIGAHGTAGGGAYPEWHVNLAGVDQVLYSKIANSGDASAWVQVKFTVKWVEGEETEEYWSNEMEIPAVYRDPDTDKKVFPLVIVQTDPFEPENEGKYTVTAALYFKSGDMADYVAYELFESSFGGTGTARDPATKFKVAEQM